MLTLVEHISGKDSEYLREKFIELYQNPYCTYEYYELYFDINELKCISIFEDGKLVHLLVIKIDYKDKVICVYNIMLDLNIKYIDFLSKYLFSKEPQINKIQFDHLINTTIGKSIYPKYDKLLDEAYTIKLPNSGAEYLSQLSNHMRRHTKNYISKINRNIGQFSFNLYEKHDISDTMFYQLVDMKIHRMNKKMQNSVFIDAEARNTLALVKRFGFLTTIEVNGEVLAGMAIYCIENRYFAHLISNNPIYDKYNVSHTCFYLTIQRCIELGGKEWHMLWTNGFYKKRFLGVATQLHSITITRYTITKYMHIVKYVLLPKYKSIKRNVKQYIKRVSLKVS